MERAGEYVLRPWNDQDTHRFVELLDNPRVWEHLPEGYPNPLTEDIARDLIQLSNDESHHEVRAIERDGEVVGQVRMLFDGPKHSLSGHADAEISYWLGEDYWGQGIAGHVIPLATHFTLLDRPGLTSIFARVHERNVASRKALERAGYRFEGQLAAELDGEPEVFTYRFFREESQGSSEPDPANLRRTPPRNGPHGASQEAPANPDS
jgi:RimJ/RimL family protein N-acetyltransferase